MNPRFPIYVVSKGRWESRLTIKALERMNVPYHVIIETEEFDAYSSVISPLNLVRLDPSYQADYDTCDDLGDSKGKGPGPARNFAWDHSTANGHPWHWVLDDNINSFYRLNLNLKIRVYDGAFFRWMEDFALRYVNVAIAGPNYEMFGPRKQKHPPYTLNTRIYSCNLIRNDLPYRWRGRYNEDTDLSLRALKDGWCTVQFNAFLQDKVRTQTLAGGNTAESYDKEGTLPKSRMQVKLHPDVSRLVWKFHRWHHDVDYSGYHTPLIRQAGLVLPSKGEEYGMKLTQVKPIKSKNLRRLVADHLNTS